MIRDYLGEDASKIKCRGGGEVKFIIIDSDITESY